MTTPRNKRLAVGLTAAVLLAASLPVLASGASSEDAAARPKPAPLKDLSMIVVYSATDRDAQLFIKTGAGQTADGETHPIRRIALRGPNGERVIDGRYSDWRGLGQADLVAETPEPTLATLKKAYPPGTYRWSGRAVDGRRLRGTSRLRYKLLAAPVITSPSAGQNGLPTRDAAVTWQRVPGAATIHLEVETEGLHRVLTVDLSGDATSFVIPDGFRLPNRPYVLDIKAVAPNGNLTVSDLKCHTG